MVAQYLLLYQLAYVQALRYLAYVLEEVCAVGTQLIAQRHCQHVAVLELGEVPLDVRPDVDYLQLEEV